MADSNSRDVRNFCILTVAITVGVPFLWAAWPIVYESLPILIFDANLIVILPIAFWMIRIMATKDDDSDRDMIALGFGALAMCAGIYFLKNENVYMHSKFEALDAIDRFRAGTCWSAFIYACGVVIISAMRLYGYLRSR